MKRVVLVLACIVLVMASVGTVAADSSRIIHLPMITSGAYDWTAALESLDGVGYLNLPPIGSPIGHLSSDCSDPLSIVAIDGIIGDPASEYSIANPSGRFGSIDSPDSAYAPDAKYPPYLGVCPDNGLPCQFIAHVTKNPNKTPRVDPDALLAYYRQKSGCW